MILVNKVKCLSCGEVLTSTHRHDFVQCRCENQTFTDGGIDYERHGGKDSNLIESLSVYSDSPFEEIREHLMRGVRGKNGDEPLKYVALKDLDTEWLENIISYEEELMPSNKFLPYYKKEQKWRKSN